MVSETSRLLIRADAGPQVGTGHVMRTLALGQAWKKRGGSVAFVCGELPRGLIKRIESEDFQVFQPRNYNCDSADANDTAEIASDIQPDWIVVDGYRFDDDYQRTVHGPDSRLLVIDDHGHATHRFADLILNQNVYASPSHYSDFSRGKVLAGPQYVLLRNEYGNRIQGPLESKRIVSNARRILVNFGGADPDNWTLKSLQVLSDLNRKRLVVDCVVGASYGHVAELEMFKKTANMNLRIHRNIDRLSQLMFRVDLAITSGGSACYELAHYGIPAIVASTTKHQLAIARAMNERGVMVSIDEQSLSNANNPSGTSLCDTRLKHAIQSLINNQSQRKFMSDQGRRLVDGKGAQRIAKTMSTGTISVRPATMEDANTMWHWQNDPEVRSVSLDDQPIPFAVFTHTLRQCLSDRQTQIWIAEDSLQQPIGQVRFEANNASQPPLISIIVDQARRGRGLGALLVSRACEDFFRCSNSETVMAQIKPGNVASEKAFRAAGFLGIEPAIVNGKMAIQFLLDRNPGENAKSARPAVRKSA